MRKLILLALLAQGCAHRPGTMEYIADLNERLEIAESRIQSLTDAQVRAGIYIQSRADSIMEAEDLQCGQSDLPVSEWGD